MSKMSRTNTLADPMSTRQERFITDLRQRATDLSPLDVSQQDMLGALDDGAPVSKTDATYLISGLLKCPTSTENVAEGYYWHDGAAYKVVTTGDGQRLYAKRLRRLGKSREKDWWQFDRGAYANLKASEKATLAQCVRRFHAVDAR
jgi:hypothetical protein